MLTSGGIAHAHRHSVEVIQTALGPLPTADRAAGGVLGGGVAAGAGRRPRPLVGGVRRTGAARAGANGGRVGARGAGRALRGVGDALHEDAAQADEAEGEEGGAALFEEVVVVVVVVLGVQLLEPTGSSGMADRDAAPGEDVEARSVKGDLVHLEALLLHGGHRVAASELAPGPIPFKDAPVGVEAVVEAEEQCGEVGGDAVAVLEAQPPTLHHLHRVGQHGDAG